MTGVSGTGSWPASDVREAQAVVVGELTSAPEGVEGIPFAVNPHGRGPWADPVGRAAALLVDMPTELGVHGWALADRPGRDLDRARSVVGEDLDALAVAAFGYAGRIVVPVVGPLTLAATLYLARGDRVVSDTGAVRELTESLGVGIAAHVDRLRGHVPGAQVVVLVDEHDLAAVIAGAVPSFSGRAMLRSVPAPAAAELLSMLVDAVREASGSQVVIDVGPAWTTVGTAVSAGADAVALAVGQVGRQGWERVAETVEAGIPLWAAVPGRSGASDGRSARTGPQARVLHRPWREVGLPVGGLAEVVVLPDPATPPAGGPEGARRELADLVVTARELAEIAAG